jgi:hypothetical protein
MSNFSNCSLTWHFCTEQSVLIEKKIYRYLRFIYNNSDNSYETLLQISKLLSLKTWSMKAIALEPSKLYISKVHCFNKTL